MNNRCGLFAPNLVVDRSRVRRHYGWLIASLLVSAGATPSWAGAATYFCNGEVATIVGTPGNDIIEGTAGDDVIVGRGGSDTIRAGPGDDTVCSGPDYDDVYGEEGNDVLVETGDSWTGGASGGSGNDLIVGFHVAYGGGGNDTLRPGSLSTKVEFYGGSGDDVLAGSDFADPDGVGDWLDAGDGDDTLSGGRMRDILLPGPGDDIIDGGASRVDSVSYVDSLVPLYVNLTQGIAHAIRNDRTEDPDGKHDVIDRVEQVTGTGFNDHLVGDDRGNVLKGCAGFDLVEGLGGDDFLVGTGLLGCGHSSFDPPDVLDGGDGDVDMCTAFNITFDCEYTFPPSIPRP